MTSVGSGDGQSGGTVLSKPGQSDDIFTLCGQQVGGLITFNQIQALWYPLKNLIRS